MKNKTRVNRETSNTGRKQKEWETPNMGRKQITNTDNKGRWKIKEWCQTKPADSEYEHEWDTHGDAEGCVGMNGRGGGTEETWQQTRRGEGGRSRKGGRPPITAVVVVG